MGTLPTRPVIGVLHPGAMGAAIGSALKPVAGAVIWAAAGRSDRTAKRAEVADLVGVPDVVELVRRADVVVAACPPHAALTVAAQVAAARTGPLLYVEASAAEPGEVRAIATLIGAESMVDAAVIGPPAYERGRTQLWLAGRGAEAVATLFEGSPFMARVVGAEPGEATGAARAGRWPD